MFPRITNQKKNIKKKLLEMCFRKEILAARPRVAAQANTTMEMVQHHKAGKITVENIKDNRLDSYHGQYTKYMLSLTNWSLW